MENSKIWAKINSIQGYNRTKSKKFRKEEKIDKTTKKEK